MKKQLLLALIACLCAFSAQASNKMYLIVGSYSDGNTPGISVYSFDIETGEYAFVNDLKGISNPSYLAVSPDETLIYSVNEDSEGAVSVFQFDKTNGGLQFINSQLTKGAHPCYIAVDQGRNFIVAANYSGGSMSYFPLDASGHILPLGMLFDMQLNDSETKSHIHTTVFSPCQQFLFATDLGQNKIWRFSVGADHRLTLDSDHTTTLPDGSGPRHLAFHPNSNFLYCINENSGTVIVFRYRNGELTLLQTIASDINQDDHRKGSADIHLSPDGRFLYSSNRLREDGIAIFSVHPRRGTLTKVGYQKTGIHPRNFTISPSGKFLLCANRDSNSIQVFEINRRTGLLRNTGKEIRLNQPVCLKWI